MVPMRDGARLFTALYPPKDDSRRYPFLITRTPYSVSPYGIDQCQQIAAPHCVNWRLLEVQRRRA